MDRLLSMLAQGTSVQHLAAEDRAVGPPSKLAAAVKDVARLSSRLDWVGIYMLNGDRLELGPYLGAPTEHTQIQVGAGVCGTAVARNQDLNVPDVRAIDNYLACSLATRSELVAVGPACRAGTGHTVARLGLETHVPDG